MPNPTFRRWTADYIAKLKNVAQRLPRAEEIAARLGRSVAATTFKAHEPNLSQEREIKATRCSADAGPAGWI
jgi:hypothetical protein